MAYLQCFFFTCLLLYISSPSLAQQSFRPKALVIPVAKDASTLQYLTTIDQRTPLVPTDLVVNLGGKFMWVDCERDYVSSTYRPARCRSAQCSLAGADGCGDCFSAPRPGCNNNTCGVTPDNSVTHTATSGEVAQDVVSLQSTDGRNPGRVVSVPRFLFACAPTFLLQGLASGVTGMAGLGRTRIGLPSQFAAAFSFRRKFAVCLSSSTSANGVIFFGDGPYMFLPGIDASQSLTFTPLFINPVSTASAEYFIGVKSIKVNEKTVSLNTTLLSIDNQGVGGTKISTVDPHTVLEASIFKAVTEAFINEAAAMNITRVAGVAPFEVCFSSSNILSTRLGPAVPSIDLVLQNQDVFWRIFGANSMVEVNTDVLCLGFVNGGSNPTTSIVIGGHQLENTLLQFDLATSRLGFSATLLGRRTTCSNFNFTSNA
ncbi:Hepatoma-derived growth factor-related protein [Hibiscus syriacus]|uniref:Hepatoma-derived growth factor-related protein n=1 Tax=Hibiscus syriacus TaxID=106335 RepID=A0A6A2Z2H6_HIBSY|nr:probable aspartic proteinase GIP2 [Hibiscus syriacus]KAE8686141.1 Hepatoma-derived growth factor-related protein [Hibiscus syriacus]